MEPRKASLIAAAVAVVVLLVWVFWPEKNVSFVPHAVPRSAVGTETVAVARLDVGAYAGIEGGSLKAAHEAFGQMDPETAGFVRNLLRALSEQGVTQVVLPVNFGPKGGEGVGVYLGGEMKASPEDMETAILRSPTSRLFRAATLLTAIVPCGGGWRFWGMGSGESSAADSSVAKRYEDSFRSSGAALLQVVVLGNGGASTDVQPPKPSDPRIVRQLGRLRKAAEGLDHFRIALVNDASNPGHYAFASGAFFIDDARAARFVGSWKAVADDLAAVAGPVGDPGLLDRALAPAIRAITATVPRAEGRIVKWGDVRK